MSKIKIDKKLIAEKLKILERHLQRLKNLKKSSYKQFENQDNFDIAAWNLKCALEAVFEIGEKELAKIIKNNLGDFDIFIKYIKRYLKTD